MKRKIKQILLLIVLFAFPILSQSSSQSYANINATLIKSLSFSQISGDLNFGEFILSGNSITLEKSPDNGLVLQVTGHPEHYVIFEFENSEISNSDWVNENGGSEGVLVFSPLVEHTNSNSEYNDSNPVIPGNSYTLVNENGTGKLFLWVGGEINIPQTQPQGDYNGTFTITVSY